MASGQVTLHRQTVGGQHEGPELGPLPPSGGQLGALCCDD